MYTDTVNEVPSYPVQNSPSGIFLFWGGVCWQEGIVYNIVWMGCSEENPGKCAYSCMLSYSIVVSHLSFNFLCLLLLYSIYLCGKNSNVSLPDMEERWSNRTYRVLALPCLLSTCVVFWSLRCRIVEYTLAKFSKEMLLAGVKPGTLWPEASPLTTTPHMLLVNKMKNLPYTLNKTVMRIC